MSIRVALIGLLLAAGCASSPTPPAEDTPLAIPDQEPEARAPRQGPPGDVEIDVTSVLGEHLPARVDLVSLDDDPPTAPILIEAPKGALETTAPVGNYRAYIHVYQGGVPILVDAQSVTVREGRPAFILFNLLEGASGSMPLRAFDADGDLAVDRVEIALGTDKDDAGSIPGRPVLAWDSRVLKNQGGWYRGELHAHSRHGGGRESVADLVARAEKMGLDFLAIADRNTLAATREPAYRSDKLVLIPAMEWGSDAQGVALVYGMRTQPEPPGSVPAAQAECIRVQAQGGIWAVAHPCFSGAPWKWGLSYVNAIQVWNRGWREMPPMALEQLPEDLRQRDGGELVYSIAAAAALYDAAGEGAAKLGLPYQAVSANMQSAKFYDYETTRGLVAAAIGGSKSSSAKVPMAQPVTYIHAENQSLPALLEGLRLGRTYVSSGLDGPQIQFTADVLNDGTVDAGIGGIAPLNMDILFEVIVAKAQGKKLQIMLNGRPIMSKIIEGDGFVHRFIQHPTAYSVYRVQVTSPPANPESGFGPVEVHAFSSPIYCQDITQELLLSNPGLDPSKTWIRLRQDDSGVGEVHDLPEQDPPLQLN
jgi:hypothetical protein